jgi:hypothetical protein
MARDSTTTADRVEEMFPAGEDIELPRERKKPKRRGGIWIPMVVGGVVLGFVFVGAKYYLSRNDVTPSNYPTDAIVRPMPRPEMPASLAERDAGTLHAAQKTESLPPEQDKLFLSDLAVVRDGVVYPNGVDRTLFGYKYDFKDPEQVALAIVEGYNDRDERLLKKIHGGGDDGYRLLKPQGKLEGRIESYTIGDINDNGDKLAVALIASIVYKGDKFERTITMFGERSEDGDIVAYSSSFG